jgi:PAS domain S-box-containing protein
MISEQHEEQASLYAAGAMDAKERAEFESLIEHDPELKKFVDGLLDLSVAFTIAHCPNLSPCPTIKEKLSRRVDTAPLQSVCLDPLLGVKDEAVVFADRDGILLWSNPAFTAMCGYELQELRGKKAGKILQGELTSPEAVSQLHAAMMSHKPCIVELINYHKNGTPYWVSISLTPVLDDQQKARSYIAIERELTGRKVDTTVI